MACIKANGNVLKTDGVNEVGHFLSVAGRDSLSNVRKRAPESGPNNVCKAAKVVEESRVFDLPILDDTMHEGKQVDSFDVSEEFEIEYVSSVLHNNPFGHIHMLCSSDTRISESSRENYSHKNNIEECNVCNMHPLQMRKDCDLLNVDYSSESVIKKKVQTETEISEIIKGISLLNLCSNLKKMNLENRNICKRNVSESLSGFSLETHCVANTGVVFPSMTKCRDTNICLTRCCMNIESCNINKHGNMGIDGNDNCTSFSDMRSGNESEGIEIFRPFKYKDDERKNYISAVKDVESKESNEVENSPTEIYDFDGSGALSRKYIRKINQDNNRADDVCDIKNLENESAVKSEIETDFCNMKNKVTNTNSDKDVKCMCSTKEINVLDTEKYEHMRDILSKKSREVVDCTVKVQMLDISYKSRRSEINQRNIEEDIHFKVAHDITDSDMRDAITVKDDSVIGIDGHCVKSNEQSPGVLQVKNNISILHQLSCGKKSLKPELMGEEDEVMPIKISKNDVNICDVFEMKIGDLERTSPMKIDISDVCSLGNYENMSGSSLAKDIGRGDFLNKSNIGCGTSSVQGVSACDIMKNVYTSDLMYKNDKDDVMSVTDTLSGTSLMKNMDASDIICKNDDDDIMSDTSTVKTMDAINRINKTDEDDMTDTSTVKNMGASDLIYKSNEGNVLNDRSTVKYMDANDIVNKSDDDDMNDASTVKNMDASDLIYKSNEDYSMSDTNTVKSMDASSIVNKSDDDDDMSDTSTVKNMDVSDLIYKNGEDCSMSDTSTVKTMDVSNIVSKSDDDDMSDTSAVKTMDASDLIYKNDEDDSMSDTSSVKTMDASSIVNKCDDDDMSDTSAVNIMDASDLIYKNNEVNVMSDISTVKTMDASSVVNKSDYDDMNDTSTVKNMDASDLIYKNVGDYSMSDTSTVKSMDVSNIVNKSDDDDMSDTGTVKSMDASDLICKNNEDDSMSDTSSVKTMDASSIVNKSDDDDMSDTSTVKNMDASDLIYKSDEDDDMSDSSTVKDMDIHDPSNKRNEDDMSDTSSTKDMHVIEKYRMKGNSQINTSDVDNPICLEQDYVSIRDVLIPELSEETYDNISMMDETDETIRIPGDEIDAKYSDILDLEHEMLSVMSTDKDEDVSSTCSMKELMSEGSVVELTDLHCYRNVDVCSDSGSDTLGDEYKLSDVLSASYEEMSDATSLEDETITSDYIEDDVDDNSRCGDYDENEEEEEDDDDDDGDNNNYDCDYASYCEYDIHNNSREKDTMSCSSVQDTVDDLMSMASNDDDADDEMSGLINH